MSKVGLPIPADRQDYLRKQIQAGVSSTVISRAYQRKYGVVLRPQDIEAFKPALLAVKVPQREDVQQIKGKLGSHDNQLEWARAKLVQRMQDEGITNNELVNLAKELRSNIVASQQIASMNDERGNAQFVLIYGDTVQKASEGAIIDAEFKVVGDNDD